MYDEKSRDIAMNYRKVNNREMVSFIIIFAILYIFFAYRFLFVCKLNVWF